MSLPIEPAPAAPGPAGEALPDERLGAPLAAGESSAFWALFDALPVGVVLFDPDGDGFLAFNDAACAQLGYDRAAFARLRLSDVDVGPDRARHGDRRRSLRPGAAPQRFSTRQRARDGSLRQVDVTVQCVVIDGRRLGYAVWHDVTECALAAVRLRAREAELARVQRIGQLGGFEIDLSGSGFANRRSPEYLLLHGLPPAAARESHEDWVRRLHPDDRERVEQRFLAAVSGGATEYASEYRIVAPGGEVRWIRALAEIERGADGAPIRMVGAHLDVTDLKRVEAARAEQADRLLEADRRKDEFLAVLSHELRNPLSALTNALALLQRSDVPPQAPGAMMEIARRQVRQLTRLVDDLLEVSRINAGKIELRCEPLVLGEVVRDALIGLGGAISARDQALSLTVADPPVTVLADRARLAQVIENLVGNASKFSPSGAAIGVRVRADGRFAVIEVEDSGPGIPVEALAGLFQLFVQVDDSRDRAHGGLGIGLALVRRLVTLHGGSVDARSDGPGRGACFTVRLPLA